MTFNFDMTTAPHDAPVWLATARGKVIKSEWIPETKHSAGRWAGVGAPIAWQLFIVPEHPGLVSPAADVDTASEAGWTSWPGGEQPDLEDEVIVQVECRDGDRGVGTVGNFWWKHSEPSDPSHDCDILRYRVADVDVSAVHFMTACDCVGGGL